jgi:predicted solute-binding protein
MSKEIKITKAAKAAKVVNPIYKTEKVFISVRTNYFDELDYKKTYNRRRGVHFFISEAMGIRICLKKLK